jgi:DNA-binding transcriptional MocR family regulator
VVTVPTDEHGADTSALRSIAERKRPVFFYTIPAHQNPSGFVQPDPRRREVVDIAGDCGFIILADEVYHMLTYEGRSPRPFAAYLDSGRVVSLGSFSKITAPGLRLGWFQAPQTMLDRIFSSGLLDSGGGLNPLVAAVMCRALEEGGVQRHLDRLRERYRSRRDAMQRALTEEMQELAEWRLPAGGFFFWLRLKRGDARRLQQPAREEKVSFLPGSGFSSEERYADHIRLCFAHYPEEELQEGVHRLAAALRQLSGR